MKLSPREQRFVGEYLKDLNATQAAIRCGYSKKTARSQGSRLLTSVAVQEAVAKAGKKIEEESLVDLTYVIKGIKEVAERCLEREPVMYFDKADREMRQEEVTIKDLETGKVRTEGVWQFDSTGANKALENLGRFLKIFTDKLEHTGKVTLEQIVAGTGPEAEK